MGVITISQNRDPFWKLFKILNILPLQSQYIFFLLLFVIKNRDLYKSNFEIHGVNTRYGTDWHAPISGLTRFQKRAFYFGIKVFNPLPHNIKNLSHQDKKLRLALKMFLLMN